MKTHASCHNLLTQGTEPRVPNKYRSPTAQLCAICSQPLSVHEQATGETCDSSVCKKKFLVAELQEKHQRQQEVRDKALKIRDLFCKENRIGDQESLGADILPCNQRAICVLPARRKRRFLDRLMRIISQAAAIRYGSDESTYAIEADEQVGEPDQSRRESPLSNTQLAVLGNACAACRGDCCSQGGDHAFIQVDTILDYMRRYPDQRPRDVLEAYESRLGNRSYKDACVYQSPNGCNLPREMRSTICNDYFCAGLSGLWSRLGTEPDPKAFVVAASGQNIIRIAIVDQHGCQSLEW